MISNTFKIGSFINLFDVIDSSCLQLVHRKIPFHSYFRTFIMIPFRTTVALPFYRILIISSVRNFTNFFRQF
jgi:hypothetical protein